MTGRAPPARRSPARRRRSGSAGGWRAPPSRLAAASVRPPSIGVERRTPARSGLEEARGAAADVVGRAGERRAAGDGAAARGFLGHSTCTRPLHPLWAVSSWAVVTRPESRLQMAHPSHFHAILSPSPVILCQTISYKICSNSQRIHYFLSIII